MNFVARCRDTVFFLNGSSDAAGESSLDNAISLLQIGIPHRLINWYSCVSRRRFSLGAASLFAATFSCVRHSALHSYSFSVPSAVPTFKLFRPTGCAQKTGQDRTGQDRTGQDRRGQDRTGQERTGEDRRGQERTPMWFAVVGRAKKSKLLRRSLARAGPCRVIVFFVLITGKKTSVISGWYCGQQRFAPCCSQTFWDGWTLQCFTTKNMFIRRRPHQAQSCSSRDHTGPHRLSFALAMLLTVNVRCFQRTHPLPWHGRLFTHGVKGYWYGSY